MQGAGCGRGPCRAACVWGARERGSREGLGGATRRDLHSSTHTLPPTIPLPQEGKTLENELDVVEGMKFDRGYIRCGARAGAGPPGPAQRGGPPPHPCRRPSSAPASPSARPPCGSPALSAPRANPSPPPPAAPSPYFITDQKGMKVEYENPLVLICEKKISGWAPYAGEGGGRGEGRTAGKREAGSLQAQRGAVLCGSPTAPPSQTHTGRDAHRHTETPATSLSPLASLSHTLPPPPPPPPQQQQQ